jgi:hypothetical protein
VQYFEIVVFAVLGELAWEILVDHRKTNQAQALIPLALVDVEKEKVQHPVIGSHCSIAVELEEMPLDFYTGL